MTLYTLHNEKHEQNPAKVNKLYNFLECILSLCCVTGISDREYNQFFQIYTLHNE